MSTQENKNNFDWVYYVMGLLFGLVTGIIVTGSFGYAVLGALLGFLTGGLFLNVLVKGRTY
ncbi:hypothetical protein C7T94_03225 [Pedobacter yulinensis]|uniref:Uncharacterized protein n=1 Tax=Pedobacter yulinensis TaxID=2126353 RepID=A0A2T3HRQ0_9SPHI|nr:hypothetical protein [Pedobacter yulinensis]PST85134.1 hypothetical protein C7T94_03225 [Pedobacter yulinensis]